MSRLLLMPTQLQRDRHRDIRDRRAAHRDGGGVRELRPGTARDAGESDDGAARGIAAHVVRDYPCNSFVIFFQIPPAPRVALGDSRGAVMRRNLMTMSPARSDPLSGSARSVATR